MTVEQLVQLYAPLVGLLATVFWLGVVSQRVKALGEVQTANADLRDEMVSLRTKVLALELNAPAASDLKVEMARLATTMESLASRVGEMREDNHTALKEMRSDYDKVVGELNHIIRGRLMASDAVAAASVRTARARG